MLCLQEDFKQCEPKTLSFRDYTILCGKGTGQGAPMLILRKAIAHKLTRLELAEHFVAALCGTSLRFSFFPSTALNLNSLIVTTKMFGENFRWLFVVFPPL